ncbi:calcium/proton exchanger [Pinibacter aurantiacus]|uniref:Ca(2+)/H(+) antiporter n=1 Tax=Pinibacter aurantiacus TaxID=2851599 RepID=A0A9E2W500_9BACT|nr:calcium/proton exchanger [Pinibacter aurantiacus]MBV4358384.1 calcium/proton exchanger [Pinibacter aurantiacus]
MNQFVKDIKSKPIFWMGIAIPIVLTLHWTHSGSDTLMFLLSLVAIIPLAAFLSHATEGIAAKTGDTIGGLLNATLGNLTEMVIFIAALNQGLIELVKASIAGAVVTNSLFMLGVSFLQGGLKYKVQNFNRLNAFIQSSLLFVVCIALMIPTIVTKVSEGEKAVPLDKISLGIAVLLMVVYLLSLFFSLKTHSDFFKSEEPEGGHGEEHVWPVKTAVIVLIISATCIAIVSEIFVEGVQDASEKMGLSQGFVGFIIIPIVGAAAEMMSAFSAAKKNKLDISVGIAMGSSAQIALFVTPLMVLLSYFIAPVPMDLSFKGGLIFMLLFGTLTVVLTSNHGKSTWYLGVLLLSVYAIFGITLYFLG